MAFSFCTSKNSSYLNEFTSFSENKIQPTRLSYKTNSQLFKKGTPSNISFQIVEFSSEYKKSNIPYFIKINAYAIKITPKLQSTLLYINNKSQNYKKYTILYIIDNNSDVGTELPFLIDLSIQFKLNVITFDYSSRGQKVNSNNLNNEIILIMNFIKNQLNIPTQTLIIIGKGIGVVPACFISSKEEYSNIFRLILISPIFEGNKSSNYLREITCKTLLIQEKKNKKVDYIKVSKYCNLIKNIHEWFPNEESFNKVLENRRFKFYSKIKTFINNNSCSNMSLNGNLSLDLSQTLSSSTKNPNILLNNDKKDETHKEEDFYLNQSIIKQRKSNVFSDEEEFDDL
jgi:hypothetical protein